MLTIILLFSIGFLDIGMLDIIDICLVTLLLYQFYRLLKGSLAFNIFLGLISVYFMYLLVTALDMRLVSGIFEQFISIGVLALLIVFQPEIRRFLLVLGRRGFFGRRGYIWVLLFRNRVKKKTYLPSLNALMSALANLSKSYTGASIILTENPKLLELTDEGETLNADVSSGLIESIFFKNAPMHDGAILIVGNKIISAKCVMPVSESSSLPGWAGLRHRSAVGITEISDALVLVVSEQTGHISYARGGKLYPRVSLEEIKEVIEGYFEQ